MEKQLLPAGMRTDGSYYTRIEWASHTETDPTFWVCNIINDDHERTGGVWGAHTTGPADLVLSFFGEEQQIGKIRFFANVGLPESILEELAKEIRVYVSDTEEPRKLRTGQDRIDSVPWKKAGVFFTKKEEGWQEMILEKPVRAKYVRFEMAENHGASGTKGWTEMNEIKIYP
jgi:hypothetical protein